MCAAVYEPSTESLLLGRMGVDKGVPENVAPELKNELKNRYVHWLVRDACA